VDKESQEIRIELFDCTDDLEYSSERQQSFKKACQDKRRESFQLMSESGHVPSVLDDESKVLYN
jgi:hypothetical protein